MNEFLEIKWELKTSTYLYNQLKYLYTSKKKYYEIYIPAYYYLLLILYRIYTNTYYLKTL